MCDTRTLHCPFCHMRDMNINTFVEHLYHAHNTTPPKVGLGFQCKCGFLGVNANAARLHKYSCNNVALSIIKTGAD